MTTRLVIINSVIFITASKKIYSTGPRHQCLKTFLYIIDVAAKQTGVFFLAIFFLLLTPIFASNVVLCSNLDIIQTTAAKTLL